MQVMAFGHSIRNRRKGCVMTGTQPAARARANLVLATLFAGAFAAGCAEMLVVGVLDLLAISIKPTPDHINTPLLIPRS
jgi:hypothetical protein